MAKHDEKHPLGGGAACGKNGSTWYAIASFGCAESYCGLLSRFQKNLKMKPNNSRSATVPAAIPPMAPPLNRDLEGDDEALAVPVPVVLVGEGVLEETVVLVTVVDAQCVNVLLLYVA